MQGLHDRRFTATNRTIWNKLLCCSQLSPPHLYRALNNTETVFKAIVGHRHSSELRTSTRIKSSSGACHPPESSPKMVQTVGIDLGSQKCMLVADDADIVLTDTGSISRPMLVSFFGRSRLVGEEAAPQISGDSTVPMINNLLGKSLKEVQSSSFTAHRKSLITADSMGRLSANITYVEESSTTHITSLLGMFLAKTVSRITDVYGPNVNLSFAVPPDCNTSVPRAIREACLIAGVDLNKVSTMDAADCLVATYARKLHGLRAPEKASLEGKKVILIEMGHTQSTAVVIKIGSFESSATLTKKLSHAFDGNLGALHFDLRLFDHFSDVCSKKHGGPVTPGSKRGQRLILGCERIRKLLSQLPESSITVENMSDSGDVNFSLKRDELSVMCADLLESFKSLVRKALASASITPDANGSYASDIFAVEVLGGGVRMQVVQQAVIDVMGEGTVLGAKFDDASVALGAALLANLEKKTEGVLPEIAVEGSIGLSTAEIQAAREKELLMQAADAEIKLLLAGRNELESYLLEMRGAPRRKHGNTIDATALNALLDETEGWMWDKPDAPLADLTHKSKDLRTEVDKLCISFFAATEADRLAVEQTLSIEAVKAAAERSAAGEDDEDHDNRKLKKADRMRLVVKNKEEGTELFKGGNFRPAAARYHKALTHSAKFFDLSPDDEAELKALKLTLYLNLASCYIKLENWDQNIRYCDDALELDPLNPKAYFRRSAGHEAKRDFDKALLDVKKAQELMDTEDKVISKASERIKKEIQKEKDKEKKMWGKAFSS